MNRMIIFLSAVLLIVISSCSKVTDEASPASGQAGSLKSQKPVPIQGYCEGLATYISMAQYGPLTFVTKQIEATGDISHLGSSLLHFTFTYWTFSLDPIADFNIYIFNILNCTLTAANGDIIYLTPRVQGTIPLPPPFDYPYQGTSKFGDWVQVSTPGFPPYLPTSAIQQMSTFDINGGTGRFEDATGVLYSDGVQWDITIPTMWPPTEAYYQIPVPSSFNCWGEIQY